jgi:1-hydroxycarotenoid 3,4-desaturase
MNAASPVVRPAGKAVPRAVVIGAGIGGLAAALRLATAGLQVTVLERHAHLGGKIRTLPSEAGPVDAGPTVLTMRPVFEDLFAAAGADLADHVTLIPQEILARHFWPDGSQLDLFADPARSGAAIEAFAGPRARREFERFSARCARLFDGFDAPMMQAPDPRLRSLIWHVMQRPGLIGPMAPLNTLAQMLRRQFSDPRLRQLFGRYATYVGGSPYRSPALLALIWQAEAAGVWVVKGGMHKLAAAIAEVACAHGVTFRTGCDVARIDMQAGRAVGVVLADGERLAAEAVLFNGDPRALSLGRLGAEAVAAAPRVATRPRSHSARVYSFAATPAGPELAHHNVFFDTDAAGEFDDLAAGAQPRNPSLYLCAEDRGAGQPPPRLERFEIIANAPPAAGPDLAQPRELEQWHQTIMHKMATFGVRFSPTPDITTITTAERFADLFPASEGALYGQTPHGLTAAFERPTARTPIPGLYLAGGGTHPGAGVPMATISARHAAAAIVKDLTSRSMSVPMAMHGGMSTA